MCPPRIYIPTQSIYPLPPGPPQRMAPGGRAPRRRQRWPSRCGPGPSPGGIGEAHASHGVFKKAIRLQLRDQLDNSDDDVLTNIDAIVGAPLNEIKHHRKLQATPPTLIMPGYIAHMYKRGPWNRTGLCISSRLTRELPRCRRGHGPCCMSHIHELYIYMYYINKNVY